MPDLVTHCLGLFDHERLASLASEAATKAADAHAKGDHEQGFVFESLALAAEQALVSKIAD